MLINPEVSNNSSSDDDLNCWFYSFSGYHFYTASVIAPNLNNQAKQGSNSVVSAMVVSYRLCIQAQKMEIVGRSPGVTEQQLTTAASAYSLLKSSFPLIRNFFGAKNLPEN